MVLLAADIGNAHTVLGLLQPAAEGPAAILAAAAIAAGGGLHRGRVAR